MAQDVIPSSAIPLAPTTAQPAMARGSSPLASLNIFARQPAVRRAAPALAVAGSLSLAALAWWSLQTPAQQPLFTGMADADKAAVVQALQTSGIAYKLDRDTGSVLVDEDNVHRARMLLAAQGLPKAAPTGDTIMATLPLGSSRAAEGEALRGAREADIARSIEAINVIKAARVQLALPEQSVFLRESPASSASVMLTLQPGQSLAVTQVRAIRHLVAASVASLLPENVSIIDQSGALLSQADAAGDNASFALQVQIEDHYRRAIQDLLAPVIGRENFSTELHVDVDPTESQSTRETYPKNDTALRKEEGNRTNSPLPAAPAASGIPGALSNQPPPAAQLSLLPASAAPGSSPATAPTPSQSAETFNRAFEVGREISVTHQPVGRVRRLTVAVAVRATKDAKRPAAADVPALETLVKGAVGYDAARGDLVVVNARDFAVAAPPKVNFWDQPWFMPVVRQIFGVVSGLAVLWFIARPSWRYFKRQTEDRQQLLADLKHELSLAPEPQAITLDMIESTPRYADRAQLVRQYVRQDTERARQIVRQMIGGAAGG